MLEVAERVAQRLAARTLEAELREIDDRLFTQFDERQPEVGVLVQRLLPDLVEDGPRAGRARRSARRRTAAPPPRIRPTREGTAMPRRGARTATRARSNTPRA